MGVIEWRHGYGNLFHSGHVRREKRGCVQSADSYARYLRRRNTFAVSEFGAFAGKRGSLVFHVCCGLP